MIVHRCFVDVSHTFSVTVLVLSVVACAPREVVRSSDVRCAEVPARSPDAETQAVRSILGVFLEAVDRADFRAAYTLLDERWRAKYTPERLRSDFEREPRAMTLVARLKAQASSAIDLDPARDRAWLALGADRHVLLTKEAQGWRLSSLETSRTAPKVDSTIRR